MASFLVIFLRLTVPISIFRYPLAGSIAAMLLDGVDVILADLFGVLLGGSGGFGGLPYHQLDKWLDIYYLSFQFAVSFRLMGTLAKRTSIGLFLYRLIGVVAFEITGIRKLLFFFPNLFENYFLFYVFVNRFFPKLKPRTILSNVLLLFLLYIPKFGQEYLLHWKEAHPWHWIKTKIFMIQ